MKTGFRRLAKQSIKLLEQILLPFDLGAGSGRAVLVGSVKKARRSKRRLKSGLPRKRASEPVSAPELSGIWQSLQQSYFPDRADLTTYSVHWSARRQKRILASCNIRHKRVLVARELSHESVSKWCAPLLYHEMCHAVLGESIKRRGCKTPWHGRDFRALEARHPESAGLNLWMKSGGWARAVRADRVRNRSKAQA